eukprot:gene264-273_t
MLVTDDPRYTKPKKNPAFIPENKLLQTSDIEGAQPGWIPPARFNPPLEKRREFRNTNYIDDIEGTKAGTVKHSIVTTRVTDPLNPVYHSLDPGEILPNPLEPLVPATYYQRTRNGTEITRAHTSTAESFSRPTVYQEPALSEPKGSLASNKRDDYAKERDGGRRQAGPEYDPSEDHKLIRGGDGLSLERAGGDVLTEAEKLHAYLHSKPKAHLDTKQKAAITTFSGKRAEDHFDHVGLLKPGAAAEDGKPPNSRSQPKGMTSSIQFGNQPETNMSPPSFKLDFPKGGVPTSGRNSHSSPASAGRQILSSGHVAAERRVDRERQQDIDSVRNL